MHRYLSRLPLLLALGVPTAATAGTCSAELGAEGAARLVRQCLMVAPAARPACNAANTCQRIEKEIMRGCTEGGRSATFCGSNVKDGTYEGYLVGAGGVDSYSVVVRRDDGSRFSAYCDSNCDAWLEDNPNNPDLAELKPAYQGKRVTVTLRTERANGRVFGSEINERLQFAKTIKLHDKP